MDLPPDHLLDGLIHQVINCPDHLQQVPEAVDRLHADAMLVDCMMYGALAALENLNLPYAVLVHTICSAFDSNGNIDRYLMSQINTLRAKAGRPTVSSSWEAWSKVPVICSTLPELDPSARDVPPSFQYVGPVFERVPSSGWQSPWSVDDSRPLVLISFSTHTQWDETSRINRTLEALAGDSYRVLVTSGMVDINRIFKTENAVVTSFLSHDEVFPNVKLVVTHAGHGSITKSLAYGVPMICLPNADSDQPKLAAQVESLGAGLALDGDNATVEEIAGAVDRIMSNPSYFAAAERLAGAIKASQGSIRAASMLERLL
jgi:MGT family glycosyltransferase